MLNYDKILKLFSLAICVCWCVNSEAVAGKLALIGTAAFSNVSPHPEGGFRPSGARRNIKLAQSTINPNIPAQGSALSSQPIRNNFQAAQNDINTLYGITSGFASVSAPNIFTAPQTFTNNDLRLLGSSLGYTTFASTNTSASNYTLSIPPITGTAAVIQGFASAANSVLTADGSGNLSLTTTLPAALTIPAETYSGPITWSYDGDQQIMGNADASKMYVGGYASATGTLAGLLGGGDFCQLYFNHNVPTPSNGVFTTTTDSTSTSYSVCFSDAGLFNIYEAPATGVPGNPPVFVTTPTFSLSMLTGVINNAQWHGTPISVAYGGTGQTTASASFNALSPMIAAGDIIYGGTGGVGTRLAIGSGVLIGGSTPAWSTTLPSGISAPGLALTAPLTSSVTTGTAPFTVASTTTVANLSAAFLNGATFAAPGTVGSIVFVPAACNGSTDDTTTINSSLSALTKGVAILPAGDCKISGTVTIPNYVTLRGQGSSVAWSALGVGASNAYPTRLLWTAGATAPLVTFAAVSTGAGLSDLSIDGNLTAGWTSSTVPGMSFNGCFGLDIRRISIQYVGVGMQFYNSHTSASGNCAWNNFDNVSMFSVNQGITLYAVSGSYVTDNTFTRFWIYDYYSFGIKLSQWCDTNTFDHFFTQNSNVNPGSSYAVVLNDGAPTSDVGVYTENFHDFTMAVQNGSGTAIQYSLIVNKTTPGLVSWFQGFAALSGAYTTGPVVQNGGSISLSMQNGVNIVAGHQDFSSPAPTANTCTGFSLVSGSDQAGKATMTSATSCIINFGSTGTNAYTVAPSCSCSPGSTVSTVAATSTTSTFSCFFGTAQTAFSWQCTGH